MGKGDKRSRRGKIWRGTFGRTRPAKRTKTVEVEVKAKAKSKSR